MDTEAATKTTPLLSRRDKAIRIRTVAWKLSRRLDEALRDIQVKKLSDIKDIKDHFKELLNLILDIQVIKEKEVLVLIKQRPPGSLPSSPARHVEEIIITKSGSGTKSKPRVKVAWGNELGTSGFDGLIGELDYDDYDSQGITPVTHTEQPMFHTNKYADRESSLDVLQEIFAKTKRHKEENIILREKVSDLEDKLQKTHFSRKYKEIKGINAGKKCTFCEKNRQHAERYQAERDDALFDIKRQTEHIQRLEIEKESLLEELKNSNFNVKYLEKKNEKTNRTMAKLEIVYNKKLTVAENTIEDLKQNFENSELCRLQMENHSLRETINNLNEAVDEINKSSEEKLKDALEAIDEYKKEEQRYQKDRDEDKIKHAKVQMELSRQLESISSEKDEVRKQLQKNKHSAEIERRKTKKQIEDLRNEVKDLTERNARLQDVEGQCSALLKQRDQNSLDKERMQKKKLFKENEALRNEIDRLEKQLTEEKRKDQHYNNEIRTLKSERERSNQMVQNLEKEIEDINSRYKGQEDIFYAEEKKLKQDIRKLKVQVEDADIKSKQLSKLKTVDFDRNEIDQKNKELVLLRRKFQTVEEKLRFSLEDNTVLQRELDELKQNLEETKNQLSESEARSRSATCPRENKYEMRSEGFMDFDMLRRSPSSLQERYTTAGSKSDTEKENMSLKSELTVALDNIEKLKQEYNGLSERYEREMKAVKWTIDSLQREKNCLEQEKVNWKAKLDQIQSDLNLFKHKQVNQQDSSHGKIDNLIHQNRKLENDKELMRNKIYSLENEKIKLEELEKRLDKSTEENQILQSEKDKLQHKLGELSTQLKKSDARSIKLDTDLTLLQNLRTENEDLTASLAEEKRKLGTLEKRYNKERGDRLSSENTSAKLKDENDRLRRDINSERIELQKLLREKKESYQNLNTEQVLAREELQTKEREKSELVALFKDKEDKNLQKIKLYEKEVETLKSRCREDIDKMRQSEHDVETLKSRCRDDNGKIQRLEHEIETLKSGHRDENDKMRQMEREIETLKSRLTGEKANQYSAYEVLQNKNDLETCKHQKKALEDERNELQKENNELENELRSLNSKLEQFDDSARNISNLKKQVKDLEEGYRNATTKVHEAERKMQELYETVEDQKQENRDLIVKLENLDMEKKDLENKLRFSLSHYKEELERKQEDLDILQRRLLSDKENKDETSKLQKDNAELKHNLQNLSKQLKESENRLALNKEEQSSLGNKCEDLKNILHDKERELNSLKSGLQELEVLRRQVHKLDFENSELNKRLEINNKEKLSIHKENKELKNILQEKLSEVKRLEARLQQYAEKVGDIPAQKRHMDKLQSDNDELNLKCKHLQTVEKDVQKLKKEKQQLETEIISQRQNNETLNSRLEILNVEKLDIEDRLRRRSPQVVTDPRNCQNCWKYRNDISDLKREINDLRDRLSEAAGNKLRDNNPNIADLSDMNRPTSLAEKFSSLYTDEYTDAMEVIEDDMDEAASVRVMLQWLQRCYEWCQKLAKEQRDTLINKTIGFMQEYGGQNVVLSDRCLIHVKEFQKKIAVESLVVVGQICHVKSVTQQSLSSENYIVKYIKKCSELCWMMQISDPPLYLNFGVNSGENLNKNDYNVFTKSGSKIDYLVWPVLYLHKTGPMLAKGVAQGK